MGVFLDFAGLAAAAVIASPSAPGGPLPDPLGPAAQGQVQCYAPNPARKTCRALAAYTVGPNGEIDNRLSVLVSKKPPITARLVLPVEIKAGQVCATLRSQDVAAATLLSGEVPLDSAQTSFLVGRVQDTLNQAVGQQLCLAFVADDQGLIAKASVNGDPQPKLDQRFAWVSTADGYTVGP